MVYYFNGLSLPIFYLRIYIHKWDWYKAFLKIIFFLRILLLFSLKLFFLYQYNMNTDTCKKGYFHLTEWLCYIKNFFFRVGWVQWFDIFNTTMRKINIRFLETSNQRREFYFKNIMEVKPAEEEAMCNFTYTFLSPSKNFIAIVFRKNSDLMNTRTGLQ